MNNKELALQQINEIYQVLDQNIKTAISGSLMIGVGSLLTLLPTIQWLSNKLVNLFFMGTYALVFSFLLKIIFSLVLVYVLSQCFNFHIRKNVMLEKIFINFGWVFILTSVFMSKVLMANGFEVLITPIQLILIGNLLLFWGQFSSFIVRAAAVNSLLVGLLGLWLVKFDIANLATYLTLYQGVSLIALGCFLNKETKQDMIG